MAGGTVVVQAFKVIFMAEGNVACILGFYMQCLIEVS